MKPLMRRLLGVVLIGLALAAARDGYELVVARAQNDEIAAGTPISSAERRPYLVFAHAAQVAAAGDYLHALALYRQLNHDAPDALRIAARYNSANLHLRQAERLRNSANPTVVAQSLPLLELAKLGYRDVLRDDPQHWDARYNLERALRLAPEKDEFDDDSATPPVNDKAVPTMQGVTQGLP